MNPPYWGSLPRARQDYDRPQCAGTEQDMGKYTVNYNDPRYQQDHYHQREPQRPTRRMEYGPHSIPSPSPCLISGREPSVDLGSDRTMIPNGPSVELAEMELERKKKTLEEIENRIIRTKAAIALKKILPYLKKNDEPSDNPLDDQKDLVERCLTTTNESSLKERVNCILQLRKSLGLPKMHSREPKSSTTYGVGRQEDHPLKLRVKTLMDNRSRTLRGNPSFPPPTATLDSRRQHAVDGLSMQLNPYPPMSRSEPEPSPVHETWPTEGGQKMQVDPYPTMPHGRSQTRRPALPSPAPSQRPAIARGMQRFLNVLNKGVDMDLFASIVNDDSKSVPSTNEVLPLRKPPRKEVPSRLENDRAEPHQEDSHPSHAEPRSRSRSSTERPDPGGSPKARSNPARTRSAAAAAAGGDGRGISAIPASSSSSRPCPLSMCASSRPLAEEENPMQLQLQNILKTLGLSLDKEEMSGLASRTAERLYGKRKDNGPQLHNTSASETPFDPAPEPCDTTSTSAPPQPRPASRPPPRHTQGNDSMEGRKRRRRSPCSQSADRSSGDGGQRERSGDDRERRGTGGCGDAGTDLTLDGEPSGHSRAEERQQRDRHGDAETYSRQDGDRHGNPKTYRRPDGDRYGDSETYRRPDGDCYGDSEMYRRQDEDRYGDSEMYRRQDEDHHGNPETYSRQDGDRHRNPKTYRRLDGDRHGNPETYSRQDGDRHGNPETYSRQDGDRQGYPKTYRRPDGDHHGNPKTYNRRERDHRGDRVKMSSHSPQARMGNPDDNSALTLAGSTSTEHYQNAPYRGSAINGSSHVNTLGDATPYPHLSACTGPHNPPYPLPDTASPYLLPGSASPSPYLLPDNASYPLPGSASYPLPGSASSYLLPGSASSPATSTPRSLPTEGSQFDHILNPDLSKSEGQHWPAQRCLQVINIRPERTTRCLIKKIARIQGNINSRTLTEVTPALPKPVALCATLSPLQQEVVAVQKQELVAVQKQEVLTVQKQEVLRVQKQELVAVQKQEVVVVQKEPTEEERKAKLKEKLQAFNQKMKQSPFMPAPVSSCTYSDLT